MEKEFCLEEYLNKVTEKRYTSKENSYDGFLAVCRIVENAFEKEWNNTDDEGKNRKLEREKRAIIGIEEETNFYKERIKEILRDKKLFDAWYPQWYPNLYEGVFAELYGLSSLAPWAYDMTEEYRNSSSAKLIGERLYCLIDGKSVLQPQRISRRRREQLKRTLLLATPYERLEYGFHEVYLHNGIRITIYSGERTKEDQDVMVFRKYILKDLTFEHLAANGTIPEGAIELFKTMVNIGFNVIFAGQVRSGKTTFLQVWQRYEDPSLEGLAIATDPETPWHKIMPNAPVMQLIADNEELESITKSLLRGDNDYVLLEEMRDATAYNLALDITSTGTMRSKATIHDNDGINIPYKMATKIREKYGGEINETIAQIYKNFDYVIEFYQVPENRAQKRMKSIIEYSYDYRRDLVIATKICEFDRKEMTWKWNSMISESKKNKITDIKLFEKMKLILNNLSENNSGIDAARVIPAYYTRRGGD